MPRLDQQGQRPCRGTPAGPWTVPTQMSPAETETGSARATASRKAGRGRQASAASCPAPRSARCDGDWVPSACSSVRSESTSFLTAFRLPTALASGARTRPGRFRVLRLHSGQSVDGQNRAEESQAPFSRLPSGRNLRTGLPLDRMIPRTGRAGSGWQALQGTCSVHEGRPACRGRRLGVRHRKVHLHRLGASERRERGADSHWWNYPED